MRKFSNTKLREALNDPRYRLTGIAEAAGIKVQSLYALRDGESVPTANTLAGLADALEKPLDYFFEPECNHGYSEEAR